MARMCFFKHMRMRLPPPPAHPTTHCHRLHYHSRHKIGRLGGEASPSRKMGFFGALRTLLVHRLMHNHAHSCAHICTQDVQSCAIINATHVQSSTNAFRSTCTVLYSQELYSHVHTHFHTYVLSCTLTVTHAHSCTDSCTQIWTLVHTSCTQISTQSGENSNEQRAWDSSLTVIFENDERPARAAV